MTPSLRGILMLADGQRTNGTQLLRGLNTAISDQVTVVGGMSGHERTTDKHWVLRSGVPVEGFISAVGLYGSAIRFHQQTFSEWDGVGPWRRITRARDHTIFELDGRPAWETYRQYLSEETAGWTNRLPLRVQVGDHHFMRTVRQVDLESGAMTFAGDMPEGSLVQMAFSPISPSSAKDALDPASMQQGVLQLTCLGESRLASMKPSCDGVTDHVLGDGNAASMCLALSGEFSRNARGHAELHGASISTTSVFEEES